MANKEWKPEEFVTYDEYAYYGITGEQREKNMFRSDKLNIPQECRCPFCEKPLKEGSYIVLRYKNDVYYNNSSVEGEEVKIGKGCFKHIMQAYKAKYN